MDVLSLGTNSEMTFYRRMDRLQKGDREWIDHADVAATTLRAYAEKYHAPQAVAEAA
jgi:hypothetical protein